MTSPCPRSRRRRRAAPTPEDSHEALVRTRPRLAAVDITRTNVNIDVPRAVATALGAVAKIQAMRPDIVKHMPLLPIAQIDDIAEEVERADVLGRELFGGLAK